MTGPLIALLAGLIGLGGCAGEPEPEPEAEVPEKCRNVHLDRLATDWIAVKGASADPKTRMRIVETAEGYEAWYIGGFFDRKRLAGEKRDTDVRFTEIPSAKKKKSFEAGEEALLRMYVKPSLKDCALKVFAGRVDHEGKEQIPPNPVEMLQFPEQEGVTFAFQPPSRPVFLGKAATSRSLADKQIEELGSPDPAHEMGKVPVGMFSKADEDGDPGCTYDMDVYFDDQRLDASPVAAGEVADGWRPWHYVFEAPYTGNHHFEFHRYRTCEGGERTLLDVAALEAVLQ